LCGATLLVVDAELSPSQTRNLEDVAGLPVSDREAVILNVFGRHATSRRARLQVEIAHLEYLRPRIRGIGLDMDQQAGGIMGSRGPGETLDRPPEAGRSLQIYLSQPGEARDRPDGRGRMVCSGSGRVVRSRPCDVPGLGYRGAGAGGRM
jgi:hypothetical protein